MTREGELSPEGMEELLNEGRPPKVLRQRGAGSRLIFLLICIVAAVIVFFALPLLRRSDEAEYRGNVTIVFSECGTVRFLIDNEGNLFAWGNNEFGQLGDGTTENRLEPIFVMDEVASVYQWGERMFALRTDNTLWGWGVDVYEPFMMMENVAEFGGFHIICSNGSLWTLDGDMITTGVVSLHGWFYVTNESELWTIDGIHMMDDVEEFYIIWDRFVSGVRFFAICTEGILFAWGDNSFGALGDGTDINREFPTYIMSDVVAIYADQGSRTFAIRTDGSLYAWGDNSNGRLGIVVLEEDYEDDTMYDDETEVAMVYDDVEESIVSYNQYYPAFVMSDVRTLHFSYDGGSVYVIRTDGSLWMWGEGTAEEVPVHIMDSVSSIHTAGSERFVIREDGSLWTWRGTLEPVHIKVDVEFIKTTYSILLGVGVTAVQTNGSVWVWGDNANGLLGTGTTDRQIDWTDITEKFLIQD